MELKGAIVKFNHSSSSRVNSLKSNLLSLSHKELCAFFTQPDHLTKQNLQTYRGKHTRKIRDIYLGKCHTLIEKTK